GGGAGGTVAAAERVDQPRIDLREGLGPKSESLHDAGAEVVHDDIGLLREPVDGLAAQRRAYIDRDALLVAVQAPEDRALAARVAHVLSREIAGAGPLDLDDVGAKISQHLRGARPQLDLREIKHRDAAERRCVVHRPDHRGGLLSRNALTPSA